MPALPACDTHRPHTRWPAAGPMVAIALVTLAGCASTPIGRSAIQARYDTITAAVHSGDSARVRALWTADSAATGSPLAALAHASADGARLTDWTTLVQRYRMVGDTAVVDAGVRSVTERGGAVTTTSQVVRGYWVHRAEGWSIVRTEPLGAADVESAAR